MDASNEPAQMLALLGVAVAATNAFVFSVVAIMNVDTTSPSDVAAAVDETLPGRPVPRWEPRSTWERVTGSMSSEARSA